MAIGLLNGGMIGCGPLLSFYLIAAATCSPVRGAILLFAFGLGTLPALLGFSALANMLGRSFQHAALRLGRCVIVFFGVSLMNSGLVLAGTGVDVHSLSIRAEQFLRPVPNSSTSSLTVQIIQMRVTSHAWIPNYFVLRNHVPVKWIINANEMSQCTRRIDVPELKLTIKLHPGDNIVEFTPSQAGNIPWSCWMGMVQGDFFVQTQTKDP
jgi:hypothetical protein